MTRRFRETRRDRILLILGSMIPLLFVYTMDQVRWFRNLLAFPIELFDIGSGIWAGMKFYRFLSAKDVAPQTGSIQADDSIDSIGTEEDFEWSAFIPALFVGLAVALFLMSLSSHRMATVFESQMRSRTSDD